MKNTAIVLCVIGLFLVACNKQDSGTPAAGKMNIVSSKPYPLDFGSISDKIMGRSLLQPNEKVLLVGKPGRFDDLVEELSRSIVDSGGIYLGTISTEGEGPKSWSTDFTSRAPGLTNEELSSVLKDVDLGIMLPGATPDDQAYKVLQQILEEGMRRTIHFHWAGAYDLNGNVLEPNRLIDSFYQHVILNTPYQRMANKQVGFETSARKDIIRVTTPEGTDIQFSIGDRPMTRQDGEASAYRARRAKNLIDREVEIPSGAIRVAPIESSVNGAIVFPDAMWQGELVQGLTLTFEEGKVVSIKALQGEEAARREIESAGEAGRSFREFALGFNPLMPVQYEGNPWIPYYGYGAGVVRLSLGDNTELGGSVTGGYVRWNFFTNATVFTGEDRWVYEGEMIR